MTTAKLGLISQDTLTLYAYDTQAVIVAVTFCLDFAMPCCAMPAQVSYAMPCCAMPAQVSQIKTCHHGLFIHWKETGQAIMVC